MSFEHNELRAQMPAGLQDSSRPVDLNQLLGLHTANPRQDGLQQPQVHQPPVLAPQPQLPPQQPIPEFALGWAHPANMTSSVIGSSAQPMSHIIATPSWTAMFPDPPLPSQLPSASSAPAPQSQQQPTQQHQSNQAANSAYYQPFSPPPAPPSVVSNGSTSQMSQQFNVGVPFGMGNPFSNASAALFQLPPPTTLFPDVNQALTSTAGTTSAFYSSYGVYQPVQGPYPRFLTPSPEPSVLGDFELDLGDTSWAAATAAAADLDNDASKNNQAADIMNGDAQPYDDEGQPESGHKSEWAARSDDELESERIAAESAAKAQQIKSSTKRARSRANSKKDPNAPPKKRGRPRKVPVEPAPAPVDESMKVSHLGTTARVGVKGGAKKNKSSHASLQQTGEEQQPLTTETVDSPQCSHCGSMSTPLWRRGPNDELLCNACGLYQKLHNKSRPLEFLTQATSAKRAANGAAAQAAASGVPPQCHNCAATSTPMWRKDPNGNLCCNACTLYYKLHNTNRPSSLANKRRKSSAPNSSGTKTEPATPRTTVSRLPSPERNSGPSVLSSLVNQNGSAAGSASHAEPHSNSTSTTASPIDNSDLMTLPRPQSPAIVNGFAQQWNAATSVPGHYSSNLSVNVNGNVGVGPLSVPSPAGLVAAARLTASPGRSNWPSLPDPQRDVNGHHHYMHHTYRPISPFNISNDRTTEPLNGLMEAVNRQDESFVRGQ
ncbi:hypothetical protein OIV83_005323 [Microbotryomycetes sp. JL201]|nr:hypothetical protein OIV83_005323 [Microbotryomycetes sp. JL201]